MAVVFAAGLRRRASFGCCLLLGIACRLSLALLGLSLLLGSSLSLVLLSCSQQHQSACHTAILPIKAEEVQAALSFTQRTPPHAADTSH